MLPLGLVPLGLVPLEEDVPPPRRATGGALSWIGRHRPDWLGLPRQSRNSRQTDAFHHGGYT